MIIEADIKLIKANIKKLKKTSKLNNLRVFKKGGMMVQDVLVNVDSVRHHLYENSDAIDMLEQLMPDVNPADTQQPANQQVISYMYCYILSFEMLVHKPFHSPCPRSHMANYFDVCQYLISMVY